MRQELEETHRLDKDGNPTGGMTQGCGLSISWQHGPLGRGADRKKPNGAFVVGVIQAVIGRLEFYQKSKFHCFENDGALTNLYSALDWLDQRTRDREERGVEGTHEP